MVVRPNRKESMYPNPLLLTRIAVRMKTVEKAEGETQSHWPTQTLPNDISSRDTRSMVTITMIDAWKRPFDQGRADELLEDVTKSLAPALFINLTGHPT
jgi:hypothetical protein